MDKNIFFNLIFLFLNLHRQSAERQTYQINKKRFANYAVGQY